jgi:two-component system sensor histidine kinase YesM
VATKINLIIIFLTVPILVLYSYSNNVSEKVVSGEMARSNANQLEFMLYQLDSMIEQSMLFAYTFREDPNVRKFKGIELFASDYDMTTTKTAIADKLVYQNMNSNFSNDYSIYAINKGEIISTRTDARFDLAYLKQHASSSWNYRMTDRKDGKRESAFYWYTTDYVNMQNVESANVIIEAILNPDHIRNMLDQYKGGGRGDPFLYHPGEDLILNRSADHLFIEKLVKKIEPASYQDTDSFSRTVEVDGDAYLVNMARSSSLNWYLMDYVSVKSMLSPIEVSRNLFYTCIALLVLAGFLASLLIYRNFLIPIKLLIKSFYSLKRGDYSTQITYKGNNDFTFLFEKFNEMSRQIKELIENVYTEKLRAKEATLKQLQSQINPHFLYNCLGFIINMTKMKQPEAVVTMAHNLSDYYRYTTRLEKHTATVAEEMELLRNYLEIQKLRMDRIWYEIQLEQGMERIEVPRLLLQPLVENAIIHGISRKGASGYIRITGRRTGALHEFVIEDDGGGMSGDVMSKLTERIANELNEEAGYGTWNINQRMIHFFGEDAGLRYETSELGGAAAILYWKSSEKG